MKIEVYSKTVCPFCTQAKAWLKNNGFEYQEVNLDNDEERMAFYERVGNGVRTVPQIYVDGTRLGGFQDLIKSDLIERRNASSFDEDF